jgi:hypothetical protein
MGEIGKAYRILVGKHEERKPPEKGVDRMIILKWMLGR